jgi:hypothetical protein
VTFASNPEPRAERKVLMYSLVVAALALLLMSLGVTGMPFFMSSLVLALVLYAVGALLSGPSDERPEVGGFLEGERRGPSKTVVKTLRLEEAVEPFPRDFREGE